MSFATDHARERYVERYGCELTEGDAEAVVRSIRAGEGMLMSRHEEGERWMLLLHGRAVHVVVDLARTFIVTALPLHAKRRLWYLEGYGSGGRCVWL